MSELRIFSARKFDRKTPHFLSEECTRIGNRDKMEHTIRVVVYFVNSSRVYFRDLKYKVVVPLLTH